MYDPDAPTGSGWWHWQLVNIPSDVYELSQGVGKTATKFLNTLQIENDYGVQGFGGACPPVGDKPHRYQFTVYALSVETLNVSSNSSGALVGYMIKSHAIDSSTLEAIYSR